MVREVVGLVLGLALCLTALSVRVERQLGNVRGTRHCTAQR